jgi:Peptidase MA superfamily
MIALLRALTAALLLSLGAVALPATVMAAEPTFGTPTASASLGQPLTVTSTIDGTDGGTVDLLVGLAGQAGLAGDEPQIVVPAHPGTVAGGWEVSSEIDVSGSVRCTCYFEGQSAPNTQIEYQFRVRSADGTTTLGPIGQVTVTDDRFQWQTLEQDLVRVHWYEGDQAFAQAVADVANKAIDDAAALLGTTLPQPVDLFVYATQQALLDAVSPSNDAIAGEAHSDIGTMFVWLAPSQAPSESAITVAHELTHLVFNETTLNPYHEPPRWLNEGIAVYLSEGYSEQFRGVVNGAASTDTLIPLQGLAGFFPSPYNQFLLAYGESVSGVDYFVRTYSDETLWNLVRSYAQGLSDDDAFTAATGSDMEAFNAAWMASLNETVPEPLGPQPAPAGPVPSAWIAEGQPTLAPGSPGSSAPAGSAPGRTTVPATPVPGQPSSVDASGGVLLGLGAGVLVVLAIVGIVFVANRSNRNRRPPPQPPNYG